MDKNCAEITTWLKNSSNIVIQAMFSCNPDLHVIDFVIVRGVMFVEFSNNRQLMIPIK